MPFVFIDNMRENTKTLLNSGLSPPLLIIGAGHFGRRAAKLLAKRVSGEVWVIDENRESLDWIKGHDVIAVQMDGVDFLLDKAETLPENTQIIPAVPIHLAYEFAKRAIEQRFLIKPLRVPQELKSNLPYVWEGDDGSFLVSYANFKCPDDCPEPLYCTVTGEKRDKPLFALLGEMPVKGFHIHIIRSRQMAPGVGGYSLAELLRLCATLEQGPGKWLVGTACKCHGVLSGLEIKQSAG